MNPDERIYGQGKLTYRLLDGMKVSYNYILISRISKSTTIIAD